MKKVAQASQQSLDTILANARREAHLNRPELPEELPEVKF